MIIKKKIIYDNTVYFLLCWCVLQEVVLSLIYKISSNYILTNLLFYMKDIMMVALFLTAFFKYCETKFTIPTLVYFSFLICILIFTLLGVYEHSSNFMGTLQSLRNYLVLPCFVVIGRSINDKEKFVDKVVKYYFPFIVFCSFLGIVEYYLDIFIGTKIFWTDTIGYTRFYTDIKHQEGNMLYGLPANFYGSYGGEYFSVKRLVGPWANPLTSAYSMVAPMVYYFYQFIKVVGKRKLTNSDLKEFVYFCVMLCAVYLTHTRLILIAMLLICSYYLVIFSNKKWLFILCAFIGSFVFFISTNFSSLSRFLVDGSTISHVLSVTTSLANMNWSLFGNGLNYIGIYGLAGATESSYITLIGNIGFFGFLLFMYVFLLSSLRSYRNSRKGSVIALVVFLSSLVYIISGFVSEQLFAYTTIAPFSILLGLCSVKFRNYDVKKI